MGVDFWPGGHLVGLFLALLSFFQASSAARNGFNGLLSKTIEANVTCGSPKEIYYRTQDGSLHPRLRTPYVCDASDPDNSHPPGNIIDGDLGSFWQSTASVDEATIRIDLNQEMFGYEISVTFGDYRRPAQLAFYKSKDYGATFEPWHFLVSPPATEQCRELFDMEVTANPSEVDTVICQQYPSYFPLEYNESFIIDLNGHQRGDGSSDSNYYTPGILTWMSITNIKLVFTGLYKKFDRLSTAWHHYAVREVSLTTKCNCHGYANGFDCPLDEVSKQRKCKCEGNTCGVYCEICCPAYNQYPWKQADGAPWVWNGTEACEACNCNSHSDTCVYNATVAELGLSLDKDGQYNGGGVCVDCQHNTEGINCGKCKIHYYRPLNRSQNSLDSCKECGCNAAGTQNVPNMKYMDCVRDEHNMVFHPGKKPGDCYCKANVLGRTCNTCKDEFHGLSEDNIAGCEGCKCHLPGTTNASNVCEKITGQCPCKANTHGLHCVECKPGFYNLRTEDVSGCEDCACDAGAATPGSYCHNITGICSCLPHTFGKQCKSIEDGWYYPDLHFIFAEKHLYEDASSQLSAILDIPKDGLFRIMVGYSMGVSESANLDLRFISSTGDITLSATIPQCTSYCTHEAASSFIYLTEGSILVLVNSTQEDLKLEKVVAIPQEFYVDTVLGARASSHFQFQCNIDDNDMRLGTSFAEFCLSNVFSLTIAYNNGPLSCNCDPVGSYNYSTCDRYGGQCHCKPGVTGRDCSQCLPEFYGLSSSGCQPCDCLGANKLCNVTTGLCDCPPNTIHRTCEPCQCNGNTDTCLRSGECLNCQNNSTGFNCEECQEGTYGNAPAADCKECKCHQVGSFDDLCDIVTGQCRCKENVVGQDCSQCRENTFRMNEHGCEECQCNPHGSSSLQCNETGQCSCLDNVEGAKCTQCVLGYYGLPEKPCEACGCSSVGSVNGTICTNDEHGRCVCKPGVGGRACDSCKKQYTNFTSLGCSRCTGCSRNLQNQLDLIVLSFMSLSLGIERLQNLTKIDVYFIETNERVDRARISSEEYANRLTEGQLRCRALITSLVTDYNTMSELVTSQNQMALDFNHILSLENAAILDNLLKIQNETEISRTFAEGIPELVDRLTETLSALADSVTNYVHSAQAHYLDLSNVNGIPELVDRLTETLSALADSVTNYVHSAQAHYLDLSNVNVEDEITDVQRSLGMAKNLSEHILNITSEVLAQDALAEAIELSMNITMEELLADQSKGEVDHEAFLRQLRDIYGSFLTATALVDNIKDISQASTAFVQRATEILENSEDALDEAQENIDKAQIVTQTYKAMSVSVQGELEISMLQYDFKESVFLMKILQARNLLARDLQSGSSDPYAIISILPAWRDQGSQKSRIINETTSPKFPFYDIFRFHINVDEVPLTKLIITLYDYDAGDQDDCLGEVVIDLKDSEFFNQIVTKWFDVQAKGSTSVDSGSFNADDTGLIDLTKLLQMQIDQLGPKMTTLENKLSATMTNVTNLKNIVDAMNRTAQEAFEYASKYLEILRMYEKVPEITGNVADSAAETKEAIDELLNYLERKSGDEVNHYFELTYKDIEELHNVLSIQNISRLEYLKNSVDSANQTFQRTLTIWNEIDQHFVDLQHAMSLFQTESQRSQSINELMAFWTNVNRISYQKMAQIAEACDQLVEAMVPMVTNITNVLTLAANHTDLINEAVMYVSEAETKLTRQPNPSDNVLSALPIKEDFENKRDSFAQRITAIEQGVARVMNLTKTLPFAMEFAGNGALVFSPGENFLQNKLSTNIVFDFKTNTSKGGILYIVTSQLDLTRSLRLYVANGRLCSATDVGYGPIVLCHPDQVDTNEWYRVFFTRYGSYYSLALADFSGNYSTVNKTSKQEVLEIDYSPQTTIYVGGLPPGVIADVLSYYHSYNGVLDRMRINNKTLDLWKSDSNHGDLWYHCRKCFPKHPPGPIHEVHFFGTGVGLWNDMGDFSIKSSHVEVELEFRILHKTGQLLEIRDTIGASLLGIYLVDGALTSFLQTTEGNLVVTSEKSSYDDGKWHFLSYKVTDDQATLQVGSITSNPTDTASKKLNGNWPQVAPVTDGTQIVFGGSSNNSVLPLAESIFAGDLKNVRLSNGSTTENMMLRNFVGTHWIKDGGVSYEGVINNEIIPGTRFFSYLPYKGYGSYAALDDNEEQVSHLSFTFKTTKVNGILMYSSDKVQKTFFYMALWDGYLYVSYHDDDFQNIAPLYYQEKRLNDNVWRTVTLNFTEDGPHLFLNREKIHTGWFGNSREPLVLDRLYIGGVEPGIHISPPVPVYWSFQGDFQTFVVNSRKLNLVSGHSAGVSIGGVPPANVLPTLAPTTPVAATTQAPTTLVAATTQAPTTPTTPAPECASEPAVSRSTNDLRSVNFGATSYEYNVTNPSYIAFNLNEQQKRFFKQSLVITLEMRSLTMNGVVFYAADSATDPKEFVSLELVNGRLRYQFSSATGKVTTKTVQQYALNALWYKIYVIRVLQLGAIVVPSTKEYHNNRHSNAASAINISTPFYIGGLPSHVHAPSLVNKRLGFIGCLRNFELSSSQDEVMLDLSNPDLKGASVGQCHDQLVPGTYFNGNAWIRFDDVELSPDFSIAFLFRTNQRSGLIFAFEGPNDQGLVLHQKLGQLVLKFVSGFDPVELQWTPSTATSSHHGTIPDSYMICQLEWYSIKITKLGSSLTLVINGVHEVQATVPDAQGLMSGNLQLGQSSGGALTAATSPFHGCLKHLTINGVPFDLSRPSSQANAKLSCPVYASLA